MSLIVILSMPEFSTEKSVILAGGGYKIKECYKRCSCNGDCSR